MPRNPDGPIGRPPKLTGEDMLMLARLHAKGLRSRTIARILSTADRRISHVTVTRWIKRAKTPPETVRMALAALQGEAVASWETAMKRGSKYGKHAPAKDLLVATGAIEADRPIDRLVILVGDGRHAIGHLPQPDHPIIDAEPLLALPEPSTNGNGS